MRAAELDVDAIAAQYHREAGTPGATLQRIAAAVSGPPTVSPRFYEIAATVTRVRPHVPSRAPRPRTSVPELPPTREEVGFAAAAPCSLCGGAQGQSDVAWTACGHIAMCRSCFVEVERAQGGAGEVPCPTCAAAREAGAGAGGCGGAGGTGAATGPRTQTLWAPSDECVVCMDAPPTRAFVPCGHVVVCAPCALGLAAALLSGATCPTCRADIEAAVPIGVRPKEVGAAEEGVDTAAAGEGGDAGGPST